MSCISQKESPKKLKVKEILGDKNFDLVQVSQLLEEHTQLVSINTINWKDFPYRPEVSFRIAHANNQIWLKYYVSEKNILGQVDTVNGGVSGDNGVETEIHVATACEPCS
jgi:hypothetical protein